MGKFKLLSRYHLCKNKGQYLSFSLLVLVATMIFGIGLINMRNFGQMYEEKYMENECADVFCTLYTSDWNEEFYESATHLEGVVAGESRENIMLSGSASYAETGNTMNHIFFNMGEKHTMGRNKIVGDTLKEDSVENPIYISYWVKANGCELGDTYKFVSGETTYQFTIVGFVEDLMYGNNNCLNMGVYMSEKDFKTMYDSVPESTHARTLNLRLKDRMDGKKVFSNMSKLISGKLKNTYNNIYGYYEFFKASRTATADIMSAILVAFSGLLVLITLLVINFRIRNSMEEEMQNMGVMTSMGYTSRQVIWSVAVPYVTIGILSTLLGILGCYLFLPIVQGALEKLSGLKYDSNIDLIATSIVVVVMIGLVLFDTLFSARKIKKLHPIEALRSGIKHHSFKKNYFTLEKSKTNLNVALGLKGFISGLKQYIVLCIIIVVATFAMAFMASSLYNSMVEPENFINLVSEESPTIVLNTNNHDEAQQILKDLSKDDRVKQAFYYSTTNVMVGDDTIGVFILDDYDKLLNDTRYEGRSPKHNNELVLGCTTAEKNGVGVGDTIKVTSNGKEIEYRVVGLLQSPNYSGEACSMTTEGYRRLKEEFTHNTIYVYLEDAKTSATYTNELSVKYKDQLASYSDQQSMIDEVYDNFIPIMAIVIGIISVVVVILVAVVLYIILKTVISHRKQELGISKALGYTTNQLVLQMAYSIFPSICIGSILGGILGYLYGNNVWLLCLYGVGIRKVDFPLPGTWVVILIVAMIVASTIISVLLSRRIKRISAIKLIHE